MATRETEGAYPDNGGPIRSSNDKVISVVIPLFNAMPYFKHTVQSIRDQSFDLSKVEVLVIDDGSTDGSGHYADAIAAESPELFRVWHIGASGGPSAPRNIGIDNSNGEYLFFCDSDDWFGNEAFERMIDHAREWNSDVLLVKMIGENGRDVPHSMFHVNQAESDVYSSKVYRTQSPCKLWRRRLIADTRFDEDLSIREDELFVSELLLRATVISVAADYDYYHVELPTGKTNLMSASALSFDEALSVFTRLVRLVAGADGDIGKVILPRIFRSSWAAAVYCAAKRGGLIGRRQLKRLYLASEGYIGDALIRQAPLGLDVLLSGVRNKHFALVSSVVPTMVFTPNGSFEEYRPDNSDVVLDRETGSVSLVIRAGSELEKIDMTAKIPFDYSITRFCYDSGSVQFHGILRLNEYWQSDTAISIMFVSGDVSLSVPCLTTRPSDTPCSDLGWSCTLNVGKLFEQTDDATRLDLYMELECNGYRKRFRFGSRCTASVPAMPLPIGLYRGYPLLLVHTSSGNITIKNEAFNFVLHAETLDVIDNEVRIRGDLGKAAWWDDSVSGSFILRGRASSHIQRIPLSFGETAEGFLWSVDIDMGDDVVTTMLKKEILDCDIEFVGIDKTEVRRFGHQLSAAKLKAILDEMSCVPGSRNWTVLLTAKGNLSFSARKP